MLNWGKDEVLKIWCIWKIEIWSEGLVDGHYQPPLPTSGALFLGGQSFDSVPNPF